MLCTEITGNGPTLIITVSMSVHPLASVTVNVYVVVVAGLAIGLDTVELLSVPAGLHKYVAPPLPLNNAVSPSHIP